MFEVLHRFYYIFEIPESRRGVSSHIPTRHGGMCLKLCHNASSRQGWTEKFCVTLRVPFTTEIGF